MKKLLPISALSLLVTFAATALAADEYDVSTASPPQAKAKERSVAKVSVRPKAGYHVNVDYPTKLTVKTPDGVTVEKTVQTGKDAARLEKDGIEFEVAFVSDGTGTKSFSGTLAFATCTDTNCKPARESVAFDVDVK